MVFAAASLAEAFREVRDAFQVEHPEVSVKFNFAGSQHLRTQIEHGARADVFASADHTQVDRLKASGILLGQPVNFAANRLVVVVPKGKISASSAGEPVINRGDAVQTLNDLAGQGVKLALALPEVPIGNYTRILIQNLGSDPSSGPDYVQRVLANVVTQELNVRSVAHKVVLGEVDAGIVYWSDTWVNDVAKKVNVLPIPERYNVMATYPVARVKGSDEPDLATDFIQFLRSQQGQEILQEHGFGSLHLDHGLPADGRRRS